MTKFDPKVISQREADVEALVVGPSVAWKMLDCGNTYGYGLIADGELETYLEGGSRKITVKSIRNLITRRLAAANAGAKQLTPKARRLNRATVKEAAQKQGDMP
jgi:hypothetical protein